jgi:hypothetical protein
VALVVTAVALAVADGPSDAAKGLDTPPHLVDAAEIGDLEAALGHEIYWAGERAPAELELRVEPEGSVYLRYLPPGVDAGDPRQRFLTVGTYPVADAAAALRRTSAETGSRLQHTAAGGLVLVNRASPGSVYLAYPGSDLQIEVYDPAPGRSLRLIRSGAIQPVAE